MKLKEIGVISFALAVFFFFGWLTGRYGTKQGSETTKPPELTGFVPVGDVTENMIEIKPDTIFVPVYVEKDGHDQRSMAINENQFAPLETITPGRNRDESLTAAATDWNVLRIYSGTLFDDPAAGKVTYSFPVQFNKAGQIDYHYEPIPIPVVKQRIRFRPTIGGEVYTNGQYSFGVGVQYGAFGLNGRALKIPKSASETNFALGVGVQIIF